MRIIMPVLLVAFGLWSSAAAAADPETRTCISNRDIRAKRLSAGDGYFVQTSQGWWRNTGAACPAFAKDRALITRSTSDRQCRGDQVSIVDPFSRIEYGGCVLGSWERVAAPPPRSDKPQPK